VVRNGVVDGSMVVDLLDAEVREEVRRSGEDPLMDTEAVRRFARTAVDGRDHRSLSGVVRPVDDPDAVVEELVARVAGFGPLQRYLDDPSIAGGI
jgi:pilus assembly protein CpaF